MAISELKIVLVTPVWNDSKRLGLFGPELAQALANAKLPIRWIVADDGSEVQEQAELAALVEGLQVIYPEMEVMWFTQRSRKGGAIYQAWDACSDADILAFVDADGAIDANSVLHLLKHASKAEGGANVIGIRRGTEEDSVRRTWLRALSFRLFGTLVKRLVGIHFEDTQCGLKVLSGADYRAVSSQLLERGFVFDVELLLALDRYGSRVDQLCIPWREMPGGKVHPLRDAWGMIAGLLRIRQRDKSDFYRFSDYDA